MNIEKLKVEALNGSVNAQYRLGCLYESGDGVKQSKEEALKWHLGAAKNGHIEARYKAEVLFLESKNAEQRKMEFALQVLRETANGCFDAQYRLGEMHYVGLIVKQDYKEAFNCFLNAAKNGHVKAQYWLGCMLYDGKGMQLSSEWLRETAKEEAEVWWRKAAAAGDECSMLRLAQLYLEKSNEWRRLASKDNACLEKGETCA